MARPLRLAFSSAHAMGSATVLRIKLTDGHPPRPPILQHRIENREQLPHAGGQRQLLRFPRLAQALIERAPIAGVVA